MEKNGFRYVITTDSLVIIDADPNVLVSMELLKELELDNAKNYKNGNWMFLYEDGHDASLLAGKYFCSGAMGLTILSAVIEHSGKLPPSLSYVAKEFGAIYDIPFILSLLLIKDYMTLCSGRMFYYLRQHSGTENMMVTSVACYEPPNLPIKPKFTSLKKNINYIRAYLLTESSMVHAAQILNESPHNVKKALTECGFLNPEGIEFTSLAQWFRYSRARSISDSEKYLTGMKYNMSTPEELPVSAERIPGSLSSATLRIVQYGAEYFRSDSNAVLAARHLNIRPSEFERHYVKKLFGPRGDLTPLGVLAFFEYNNRNTSICSQKLNVSRSWFRRRLLKASRTYCYSLTGPAIPSDQDEPSDGDHSV